MKLQAVTSRRMLTRRDPWVNILRNTAACFAAGVGGADIVTVRCFTDAMGLPGKLARRLARNTQVIAQEESSLGRVVDPPGGAWALEKLGDDLATAAWDLFQQIEREGGLTKALQTGGFQQGVADRAQRTPESRRQAEGADHRRHRLPAAGRGSPQHRRRQPARHRPPRRRSLRPRARPTAHGPRSRPPRTTRPRSPISPAPPTKAAPKPNPSGRSASPNRSSACAISPTSAPPAGRAPRIFLAALGPLAEHSARVQFAQNFFAAGGIDAANVAGDTAALEAAAKGSGCTLACLCGSDKRYATEAVEAARALKRAGVARVYLAGKPGDLEAALREAGVDEFIHIGVDVLASLEKAHAELGLI